MAAHAWEAYARFGLGHDEVRPVAQTPHDWYATPLLSTPVDALDALFVMRLDAAFAQAKALVLASLDPARFAGRLSVFETTIRVVGGLLGAFDLDGDARLLAKAVDLADRLLPAFDTPNGLPLNFLNLSSGVACDYSGEFHGVGLAAAGSLQLEFQYLSDLTGNPIYAQKALYVYEQMQAMHQNVPGLFPDWLSTESLEAPGWSFQIGGMADSYYEYLMKLWLSTGDEKYYKYYITAAKSIANYMVATSSDKSHVYIPVTDITKDKFGNFKATHRSTFPHLACFSGAMFAMGSMAETKDQSDQLFQLGSQLTETCWRMYKATVTGLGADVVNGDTFEAKDPSYKLRPEVVESLFYMWRLTHDQIYRDRGWEVVQSLQKHCRSEFGFHGLTDVTVVGSLPWDKQESFFLAETLKYLYLLFSPDEVLPLEKYVFNTEGHPLSVRGHGRRADPRKFVPLPTNFAVPVGKIGKVSDQMMKLREIEKQFGLTMGKSFGVEE
ncbi:hypothetical protein HK100_009528 [Physocladia obscura]|uniref:alpha-1,2-Mannosidase n=1 Tax=Physocladia obscura TaxID=109957 RepID=A0AAD5SMK9_9FUNG|nr:hypothetical protein HK100_009528 [Physocladia obscura]